MRYHFFCSCNPVRPHELPWARIITPFLNYLKLPVSPEHVSVSETGTLHVAQRILLIHLWLRVFIQREMETGNSICGTPTICPFVHLSICPFPICPIGKLKLPRSINLPEVTHLRRSREILEPNWDNMIFLFPLYYSVAFFIFYFSKNSFIHS